MKFVPDDLFYRPRKNKTPLWSRKDIADKHDLKVRQVGYLLSKDGAPNHKSFTFAGKRNAIKYLYDLNEVEDFLRKNGVIK